MMAEYANAEGLIEMKKYHGKDGKVNMCKGLEDMMTEKLEEGLALGKEQGIKAFVEACQELQVPKDETIAKLCGKFNTTRERAEETLQNYWK